MPFDYCKLMSLPTNGIAVYCCPASRFLVPSITITFTFFCWSTLLTDRPRNPKSRAPRPALAAMILASYVPSTPFAFAVSLPVSMSRKCLHFFFPSLPAPVSTPCETITYMQLLEAMQSSVYFSFKIMKIHLERFVIFVSSLWSCVWNSQKLKRIF
jgi:hypothetical protein